MFENFLDTLFTLTEFISKIIEGNLEEEFEIILSDKEYQLARIKYIESLQREQETKNLTDSLLKITGVSKEQFDVGDFDF